MILFKQFRNDEIWWISKKVLINNKVFEDLTNKRLDQYKKNASYFNLSMVRFIEQVKKQENKDIFETKYKNDRI